MKNKKFDPFANLKLDPEEQELNDAIERGEFKVVPLSDAEKERYASYARYTLALEKKEARVNIRLKRSDLDTIRQKANKNGLPYQTLINTILHQYAKGRIKIEL
ncbi:antitoxin [Candidatus Gottesmanbacteria bacterium]|nr:antitoxin [Candidatus Gottesmanbacteria bacterium]